MPRQSVTLKESNNNWLNAHVENIGDYANKSELIYDLNKVRLAIRIIPPLRHQAPAME